MIEIKLSEEQLEWCDNHAKEIVAFWSKVSKVGSGSYNHNRISSNLVGVKSELATKIFLSRQINDDDIQCNYMDFKNKKSEGDLNVFGCPIEVKGLRPNQWDSFKRCIPPKQLKNYVKDDSLVVWTTTKGDTVDETVNLRGWNYAAEVELHGVYRKTICDNIWLREDSLMNPIDTLITGIKGECYGVR